MIFSEFSEIFLNFFSAIGNHLAVSGGWPMKQGVWITDDYLTTWMPLPSLNE